MSSVPTGPADSEAIPPDHSRRLRLMRRLLRTSIGHYHRTLAFARKVEAHFPDEFRRDWCDPVSGAFRHRLETAEAEDWPRGERGAWFRLRREADDVFFAAEVELATRIVNLYDHLAPEAIRVGPLPVGAEYPERAVRLDGRTYMVLFDPETYTPGDVIIAMSPIERTVDLDD